jgi:putative ABC transport system permease protein
VGDTLLARIAGRLTPVVVRGTVDYFPTLGPGKGGFVIADLKSLLGYINIMGYPTRMDANEIFANKSEDAGAAFEETLDGFRSFFVSVSQRSDETELARLDPLGAASWRAAVLLALAIVLTAAALGYASYVLSHTRRSRVEVGFLQSLGLSRRQLMGILGIEHLTVSAIGLGLGTWAGFRMTGLMVSPLTVTEAGEQVVPPFILTTDWQLMLPTYAAMAAIFLATQVALNRSIARLDLVAIARLGD